jgi:hypothetical protein
MVIMPGQHTSISISFMMHGEMGGQHDFRVHLLTNDSTQPDKQLTVRSNWVP